MIDILKSIPFFAPLSEENLERMVKNVKMEYLPANHVIFKEGDIGHSMHIIKRGKVQVLRENRILNELSDHDFFGEMALVSDVPRNATIKTLTDVELLTLEKEDFQHLMENDQYVAAKVSEEVINRINEMF